MKASAEKQRFFSMINELFMIEYNKYTLYRAMPERIS